MNNKEFDFSSEITFKSIFRNNNCRLEDLDNILREYKIKGEVTKKESSSGKFCSYSISAVFPSDEVLKDICEQVASLEDFMTMF